MSLNRADYSGGCHCGAVRFKVRAPQRIDAISCNCSICKKTGFLHLIVAAEDFSLISGDDYLSKYTFNTGVAQHLFCSVCGVKSFYVPRSHPDGYSVNVNCLELDAKADVHVCDFDGANWESAIGSLGV